MLPALIQYLFKAGQCAASADNSQPWHFFWDGQLITIAYDEKRVGGKTFAPDNPGTLLAIGSVIEQMTQAADIAGIALDWTVFGDYQESQGFAQGKFNSDVQGFSLTVADDAMGMITNRHTNRLAYNNQVLPDALKKNVTHMSEHNAQVRIYDNKDTIKKISELVYRCSEVRFQTQEVHEWLGQSLKFTQSEVMEGHGLDVATFDLPPGGKLFLKFIKDWQRLSVLNKVGGYKLLATLDAEPIKTAASLIAISSGPDIRDMVDAGRLMTRAWIELNAQGVGVQPFFVITDQLTRLDNGQVPEFLVQQMTSVKQQCGTVFSLQGNEYLYMLLRVGFPKAAAVRSQRLGFEQVVTDHSM